MKKSSRKKIKLKARLQSRSGELTVTLDSPEEKNKNSLVKYKIRPIMGSEEGEVLRIIRSHDETDAHYAKRYYDEYFYTRARSKDRVFVAVTPRNKVVGVSGYFHDTKEPKGIYWLAWTYVIPSYRHYGVGGAFIRLIERELRGRGARKIYLNTSSHNIYKGAIRFYLDRGFKWEGYLRDYYRKGEDQIILGKTISRR
ncbi:MAG: GNAT family N-acetyltransferase [Candidatus Omnitrophica bacterium]|nr:GNAT family N-acetyltransferase [Candidatus Omnitrophota bacterium]